MPRRSDRVRRLFRRLRSKNLRRAFAQHAAAIDLGLPAPVMEPGCRSRRWKMRWHCRGRAQRAGGEQGAGGSLAFQRAGANRGGARGRSAETRPRASDRRW
jgi:hypothetical protein